MIRLIGYSRLENHEVDTMSSRLSSTDKLIFVDQISYIWYSKSTKCILVIVYGGADIYIRMSLNTGLLPCTVA